MQLGNYKKPLLYALLVHLLAVIILSINLVLPERSVTAPPTPEQTVVTAVAVDEAKVQAELDKIQAEEQARRDAEAARQKQLEREASAAQQKRQAEEERLAKVQQQRAEQLRRQKEAAARLAKLEQQKKAEGERLAKLQEENRKADEERRRREEDEARRKQIEEEERRMQAEQQKREAARKTRNDAESLRYIALIQDKVQRNWINPAAGKKGLECIIRVRVNKDGKVLLATVVKGSGNDVFDRSVESAVLKASPLPLPKDPTIMDGFPELRFKFKPE